jgi:hypothetical protein
MTVDRVPGANFSDAWHPHFRISAERDGEDGRITNYSVMPWIEVMVPIFSLSHLVIWNIRAACQNVSDFNGSGRPCRSHVATRLTRPKSRFLRMSFGHILCKL